ncbi:MAG: ribonuclease PH [Propionibacteriaceae bacterium]|jgi:predicted metal-dependent phosphoesterase TrpH|nr:ribonuclease PH [Propionibacteriaceae bacterium]
MKRREVLSKLAAEAKRKGQPFRTVELKRHTGVIVGAVHSTLKRHAEIEDDAARKFFDQFAAVLGKGWWRK